MAQLPHTAFNEFDATGVTNTVNDFKSAGLKADYDLRDAPGGTVRIIVQDWRKRDGSKIIFEIHKLAKGGILWTKRRWVVQLYSLAPPDFAPLKRGCSYGKYQMLALHQAKVDVEFDFLSILDFDLAADEAVQSETLMRDRCIRGHERTSTSRLDRAGRHAGSGTRTASVRLLHAAEARGLRKHRSSRLHRVSRRRRVRTVWVIVLGILALLFNPLIPVHLTRALWAPIDLASAALLAAHLWFQREWFQRERPA